MKTSSAIDAVAASSLKFIKIGDGTDADVGIRGGVDVGAGIVVVGAGAGIVVGVGESETSRASEPKSSW